MSHASANAVSKARDFVLRNAERIGYTLFLLGFAVFLVSSGVWILAIALPLELAGIGLYTFQFHRKNKARKVMDSASKALEDYWEEYRASWNELTRDERYWDDPGFLKKEHAWFEAQRAKYAALQDQHYEAQERYFSLK